MRPTVIAALLTIGVCSCYAQSGSISSSAFVRVSRNGCFGTCPIYSVTLYGNGKFVYVGKDFVHVNGTKKGQIPKSDVVAMFEELKKAHFFGLRPAYGEESDLPSTDVTVRVGNRQKHIKDYGGYHASEVVARLAAKLEAYTGVLQFVGTPEQSVPHYPITTVESVPPPDIKFPPQPMPRLLLDGIRPKAARPPSATR